MNVCEAAQERIGEAAKYCRRFNCAYDVGAHVGVYALEMAKIFDRVIAFEPITINYVRLVQNIGDARISTYNAGVSDHCGEAFFDVSGKSISCHIAAAGEVCRILNLDALDPAHPAPDFIKIDVEGHELEVIRGAENFIRSNAPVIMIEEKFDDRFAASKLLVQWGWREVWRKKHDRLFIK